MTGTRAQTAATHLPYLSHNLVVVNEPTLVDETLPIRLGAARTDRGYCALDIADRR